MNCGRLSRGIPPGGVDEAARHSGRLQVSGCARWSSKTAATSRRSGQMCAIGRRQSRCRRSSASLSPADRRCRAGGGQGPPAAVCLALPAGARPGEVSPQRGVRGTARGCLYLRLGIAPLFLRPRPGLLFALRTSHRRCRLQDWEQTCRALGRRAAPHHAASTASRPRRRAEEKQLSALRSRGSRGKKRKPRRSRAALNRSQWARGRKPQRRKRKLQQRRRRKLRLFPRPCRSAGVTRVCANCTACVRA